jgi:DNA-binding NarL/FixJ family response regulator
VVLGRASQRLGGIVPGVLCVTPAGAAEQAESASTISLGLSPRQLDVLRLLAAGQSNKQISRALGVAESTIKTHLNSLFQKLGVSRRSEALLAASELGLPAARYSSAADGQAPVAGSADD